MRRKLITYAIWFGITSEAEAKTKKAIAMLRDETISRYDTIRNSNGLKRTEPNLHLEIAPDFHFMHVEQHWSPGDICGTLKIRILSAGDKVMAVLLSEDPGLAHYLPDHGMVGAMSGADLARFKSRLIAFTAVPHEFHLREREGAA